MHIVKQFILVAAIASAVVTGVAVAEDAAVTCATTGQPAQLEGKEINVDTTNEEITVRDSNGTIHEFQASVETLQEYKAGDTIKAKLRCEK